MPMSKDQIELGICTVSYLITNLLTYHGSAATKHGESEDADFYLFFGDRYCLYRQGISDLYLMIYVRKRKV